MDFLYPRHWNDRLHHKHLITFLLFLAVIFQALLITGCLSSSASSPNLYLLQLEYASYESAPIVANGIVNANAYEYLNEDTNSSSLIMRAGYFGGCIKSNDTSWHCSKSVVDLTKDLSADDDPFNIIYVGFQFMHKSVSAWMFVVSIVMSAFTGISIHFVSGTEGVGFPFAVGVSVIAFIIILISMVWQQSSVNTAKQMLSAFSDNAVKPHAGAATSGLGWASTVILLACSFGLLMMFLSERSSEMMEAEMEGREEAMPMKPHFM